MGDDRKPEYEMAPQTDPDVEKGKLDSSPEEEKKSAKKEDENEWGGLNKAQLLEVADTPFWNWTRNILLILFWVGWVAMLVAAIVIVVKVPRCPEVEWWEKSVFYRVLPQSFKDSNGDGYGDLKGLTNKLDYITGIGANVLVLSSIFEQSELNSNLGQNIVNFTNVDPTFGNLTDFNSLLTAAGEKELKVILEFVPNHSSNKHPWFLESVNRTGNFTDYYVWKDCDGLNPPDDWVNKNGDSAWTYSDERQQCYYAYMSPEQPDLNFANPDVQAEMKKVLQFWLDQNVDGFVFSGVDYIFETSDVSTSLGNRRRRQANESTTASPEPSPEPTSEPAAEPSPEPETSSEPEPSPGSGSASASQYSCVGEGCSMNENLHSLMVSWRSILNENSYLGKYRLMVAETEMAPEAAVLLYGNESREADLVLYKGFANSIMAAPTAQSMKMAITDWITAREKNFNNRWNTWVVGDERMSRIATRATEEYTSALNVILLTLPGTPIIYYGDELGTPDLTSVDTMNVARGPMYWANTETGNFTNATAWLPLPTNTKYSVETQDGNDDSVLSVFKELTEIHGEPSVTAGRFTILDAPDSIFAYVRQFPDWPGYLVVANFGDSEAKLDFEVKNGNDVVLEGKLLLRSAGDIEDPEKEELSKTTIKSKEAVIFKI